MYIIVVQIAIIHPSVPWCEWCRLINHKQRIFLTVWRKRTWGISLL